MRYLQQMHVHITQGKVSSYCTICIDTLKRLHAIFLRLHLKTFSQHIHLNTRSQNSLVHTIADDTSILI